MSTVAVILLSGAALIHLSGQRQIVTAAGKWGRTVSLHEPRSGGSTALLLDGRVLLTGGEGANGPLSTAEYLIGPEGERQPVPPMSEPRSQHISVTLPNGWILVAGGRTAGGGATNSAEAFDPEASKWTPVGSLGTPRIGATATVLTDGSVLIAGGESGGVPVATLERFDPAARRFSPALAALSSPRRNHAAALLADGSVLLAGGSDGRTVLGTMDRYDPASGAVTAAARMITPRERFTATALVDGQVLLAGGSDGQQDLASTELFDAGDLTTAPGPSMAVPRSGHVAIRIPDNNSVVFAGGTSRGLPVSAVESYRSWNGTLISAGELSVARSGIAVSAVGGMLTMAGGAIAGGAVAVSDAAWLPTLAVAPAGVDSSITMVVGANWTPGQTVTLALSGGSETVAMAGPNGRFRAGFSKTASAGERLYLTAGNRLGEQAQILLHQPAPQTFAGPAAPAAPNGAASPKPELLKALSLAVTTTTLSSSTNPSALGGSAVLTATVSPSSATGSVTFRDLGVGAALGTTPLSAGVATLTTTLLRPGLRFIVAVYSGDVNNTSSGSAILFQQVTPKVAGTGFWTASGSPFAAGSDPDAVAVGDFDGDGILDIAITEPAAGTVKVLLGDGSGGFSQAGGSPYSVGGNALSVAVGDFNKDSKLDLAVANGNSNNVAVLLGNGSGGFAAATGSPFTVGLNPVSVTIGDFNGDGNADLATANSGGANVTVLLGNGSGGFSNASGSPFTAGNAPQSVAVGDFNKDGKLDLAIANGNSNNVTVLLGNGSGGFAAAGGSPFAVGTLPRSMAVGDFNSDGSLDLAVANGNSNNVTVLLGNGLGGFAAATGSPLAAGTAPITILAADFNGSGTLDLVIANKGDDSLALLLGGGSGGFVASGASPVAVGNGPAGMAVGDFNGDGVLDLAVANRTADTMTILLGRLKIAENLSASPNPSAYGQPVNFTATITPANATGSVQFVIDGTNFGQGVVPSGGKAVATVSTLTPGSHSVHANFSGVGAFSNDAASLSQTVTSKALTVNGITANSRPYNGATAATLNTGSASLVGVVGTDNVSLATGSAAGTFSDKNVGTGKVVTVSGLSLTGTAAPNYSLTQPSTTANITSVAATVTASSPAVSYGAAVPAITPGFAGFVSGESSAVLTAQPACTTTYTPGSSVGSTPATSCSGATAANYTFTYVNGKVTISPVALKITAATASRTYGSPNPAITPAYSGFVNAETAASLTTQPVCGTTATTSSSVGTYPTTCSGAVDPNYTIGYVNGIFTVIPAAVTLPDPQTGTSIYGTSVTLTVTITAAGSGEIPTGKLSFQFTNAGTIYNICPDGSLQAQPAGTPCAITLDATGTGKVTTSRLPAAVTPDAITATYTPGDSNYTGGSTTINFTVNKAGTLTNLAITPATAPTYGDTVTLQSTVSDSATGSTGTPTGSVQFQYSTDGGTTWLNLGPPAILDGTGRAQTTTTALPAGSANIKAVYSGDTNFVTSSSGITIYAVNSKPLIVTGITTLDKTYDGTTAAILNTSGASLVGVVGGDTVTLITGSAIGIFADANAGSGKIVTASGLSLSGSAASNYSLTQPTTTAGINPAPVTASAGSYSGAYDGSVHSPSACALTGSYTGGVTCSNNPSSIGPGAGSGQVTPALAFSTNSANFSVTLINGSWNIDRAPATVTLGNLTQTFNGNALLPAAGTTPAGLNIVWTGAPQINAGTYAVTATVSDPNFIAAAAAGTFAIRQATTPITLGITPLYYNATSGTTSASNPPPAACSGVTGPCQRYTGPVNFTIAIPNATLGGIPALSLTTCGAISAPCVNVVVGDKTYGPVALNLDSTINGYSASLNDVQIFNPAALVSPAHAVSISPVSVVSPNYTLLNPTLALTVPADDANLAYNGLTDFTTSGTSTTMTITAGYTVQDARDTGKGGDITNTKLNATLTSTAGTFTGSCSPVAVTAVSGMVDPDNGLPSTGTASCVFQNVPVNDTYTLTATAASPSFYKPNKGDLNVSIGNGNDGGGLVSGGGFQTDAYLSAPNPEIGKYKAAGLILPAPGTQVDFGLAGGYYRDGEQGNARVTIHSKCLTGIPGYRPQPAADGLCVYQIVSDTIESLTLEPPFEKWASTATIQDVTGPRLVTVATKVQLQMVMDFVDNPARNSSTLSIQVLDSTYGLWFSNNWTGLTTAISETAPLVQGSFTSFERGPIYRYDFFTKGSTTPAVSFLFPGFVRDVSPASYPIPNFAGFIAPAPGSLTPCDLTSNSSAELDCRAPAVHSGVFNFVFDYGAFPRTLGAFTGSGFAAPDGATPGLGTLTLLNGQITDVSSSIVEAGGLR